MDADDFKAESWAAAQNVSFAVGCLLEWVEVSRESRRVDTYNNNKSSVTTQWNDSCAFGSTRKSSSHIREGVGRLFGKPRLRLQELLLENGGGGREARIRRVRQSCPCPFVQPPDKRPRLGHHASNFRYKAGYPIKTQSTEHQSIRIVEKRSGSFPINRGIL